MSMLGFQLHIDVIVAKIEWMLNDPAGVKLNSDLLGFLGNFSVMLIDVWNHVTSALTKS